MARPNYKFKKRQKELKKKKKREEKLLRKQGRKPLEVDGEVDGTNGEDEMAEAPGGETAHEDDGPGA